MGALGLVALATIADVVPLSDENRIIVRHGLAGYPAGPSVGLRALMEVSGSLDKKRLTAGMVGFGLAPRINAAGRLERAMMAVEMLTTDDASKRRTIAAVLEACNTRRQEVERQIVDEARAMLEAEGGLGDRRCDRAGKKGWHAGVIGIVAGRLAEMYHRPAIVDLARRRDLAGLGPFDPGLRPLRGDQGVLRRPDRFRRPRRRGRAQARGQTSSRLSPRGFEERCRTLAVEPSSSSARS